jgi:hypothetical protein
MSYPSIAFSPEYKDWEVTLSTGLTIYLSAEEFEDPSEALVQAMIWEPNYLKQEGNR